LILDGLQGCVEGGYEEQQGAHHPCGRAAEVELVPKGKGLKNGRSLEHVVLKDD